MAKLGSYGPIPTAVVQQISIGGTCAGVASAGAADESAPCRVVYAASATGGLFDFQNRECISLLSVELALGGQTVWTLYLTDGVTDTVGNDIKIAAGTTETSILLTNYNLSTWLLPGQKLKFVTTGTASKLWRITAKVASTIHEQGSW